MTSNIGFDFPVKISWEQFEISTVLYENCLSRYLKGTPEIMVISSAQDPLRYNYVDLSIMVANSISVSPGEIYLI